MGADVPLVLKEPDWPILDRQAWAALFAERPRFSRKAERVDWAAGTIRLRRQSYGQWLSFLHRKHPNLLKFAPTARVTEALVAEFVDECQARLKPRSTLNHVLSLAVLAGHFAPKEDWDWLWCCVTNLSHDIDRNALKPRLSIEARDIFRWSLKRFEEVLTDGDVSEVLRAVRYRQALMVGTLIACPVRARGFIAITVGIHLDDIQDSFFLRFQPEDMKSGKAHSYLLPKELHEPMRLYLDVFRPTLLGSAQSDRLWVSQRHTAISQDNFAKELAKLTKEHLGLTIRAHAFRDIAATSIAEFDPVHVGITIDVLAHATPEMGERFYNRATADSGCSKLQSVFGDIRKNAATMDRRKQQRRNAEATESSD